MELVYVLMVFMGGTAVLLMISEVMYYALIYIVKKLDEKER